MARGTLRLKSGLGAWCDYTLSGEGGTLELPAALYLPQRETDAGTMTLANGVEHKVQVTFGPMVGEATFVYVN